MPELNYTKEKREKKQGPPPSVVLNLSPPGLQENGGVADSYTVSTALTNRFI